MGRTKSGLRIAALLTVLPLTLAGASQKHGSRADKGRAASLPAVMWRNPGDVSQLNLFYGEGGRRDAPNPKERFVFVKEDLGGTSPKFDIVDQEGRKWKVKLGKEAQPEVAATRLVWAAGYFVDEDYFVRVLKVEKLPKLKRGEKLVSAGGIVHGARLELERKDVHKLGDWSWFHSAFEHTRQLNGLRVMMCLIDNWDLKEVNNAVYEMDGQRRFVVSDLGSSFGKTGNYFKRSKGVLKDYARAPFIRDTNGDRVDFVMHSRPFFLLAYQGSKYRERTRMEKLGQDISLADARWIGGVLGGLSNAQLRDCFRAAGYNAQTAAKYATAVEKRIAELRRLKPPSSRGVSLYEADR